MGGFSNFLEDKLLDQVLGKVTYSPPEIVYVGVSRVDPGDSGAGLDEPSTGGYARVAVPNGIADWPAALGGTKTNANRIIFGKSTGSWGTVTHFVLFDAAVGGNMLLYGPLNLSRNVVTGSILQIPAGGVLVVLY